MTWNLVFDRDIQPDIWHFTEPLADGRFFKLSNYTPQFEFRGKLAQVEINSQGNLQVFQQELLRFRNTEEIYFLPKPECFQSRRIGVSISNTNFVPLDLWQCHLKIFSLVEEDQPGYTPSVEISQYSVLPGIITPLIGYSYFRKGHITENIGNNPVLVSFSVDGSSVLYQQLLMEGDKYSWDYPEVFPFRAFSSMGSELRIQDIH